jgi:hypothetical protein
MKKVSLAFFTILIFSGISFTQSLAQKTQKLNTKGLALEVTFYKGTPPAFISYSDKNAEFGRTWYSRFRHIPNFQLSADALPVRAVNIIPTLNRDSVTVAVSVFTGKVFHEREEKVASYNLKQNERIIVNELTAFGVEPFELSLVWLNSSKSFLSTIVNLTNSLKVKGTEPIESTLPTYLIRFFNASDKPIIAFTLETTLNGRVNLSGMPQGEFGEALIGAGKEYEKEVRVSLEGMIALSKQGIKSPNQALIIKSVVFADGSHEGDLNDAALFLAFTVGRKIALKQQINLIEQFETSESFLKQIENLPAKSDAEIITETSRKFNLRILRGSVEIAINGMKMKFRQEFEQIKNKKPVEIRDWLNKKKVEYQTWLARLP